MNHLVDRLELEIQTADEALACQLQDNLSRLYHQALEQVLARVLDQLSPPGTHHRLDALTLDLGEIPADQLEGQFPQRLERALRQALSSQLSPAQPLAAPVVDPPRRAIPDGPSPIQARSDAAVSQDTSATSLSRHASNDRLPQAEGVPPSAEPPATPLPLPAPETPPLEVPSLEAPSPVAADVRPLELLAVFTATGCLPWWAPRQDARLIPTTVAAALRLPAEVLGPFLRQLATAPAAQQRLLAALDPTQQTTLRQALSRHTPEIDTIQVASDRVERLPASSDRLPESEGVPPNAEPPATPLAPPAAEIPTQEVPHLEPPPAVASLAEPPPPETSTPETSTPLPPDARLIPSTVAAAQPLSPQVLAPLPRQRATASEAQHRLRPALDSRDPSQRAILRPDTPQTPDQRRFAEASSLEPAANPQTSPIAPDLLLPSHPEVGDMLTVDGSGLVLLWPFLETLFNRLEWLTPERRFIGAAERQRAMALLGFLVDGDPSPPEWRLTLVKVLCGLPLDAVCSLEQGLSAAELAEAEKLLEAVLAHGDGLLGEDGESLRERWLRRPGLLSWRPQAWLLVVERREDDDGVLDQLPWSVSWIRLPWMADLVQVAW
jgi:hypothetical protein